MPKHKLTLNPARFTAECSCGWKLTGDCDPTTSAKLFNRQVERLHNLCTNLSPPLVNPKGRQIIGPGGPVVGRLNTLPRKKGKK